MEGVLTVGQLDSGNDDYDEREGAESQRLLPALQQPQLPASGANLGPVVHNQLKSRFSRRFPERILYMTVVVVVISLVLVVWILVPDKDMIWFVFSGVLFLILLIMTVFYIERIYAMYTYVPGRNEFMNERVRRGKQRLPFNLLVNMIALVLVGISLYIRIGVRTKGKGNDKTKESVGNPRSLDSILMYIAAFLLSLQALLILRRWTKMKAD